MVVWWHALLTAMWGGLMALERRAFLQAMVSRPLVAGAGVGFLLDDVVTGLSIGLVFELLHLGGASLGGAHAHHETLPAIAAAAMGASMGDAAGSEGTPAMWSVAILLCAPSGWLGRMLENRLDVRARKYVNRARRATSVQEFRHAARQNLRAMWPQFVFYGVASGFACLLGYVLAPVEQVIPLGILRGLAWAYPAMGVVAAAVAVQGSRAKGRSVIAGLSAIAVSVLALAHWYRGP